MKSGSKKEKKVVNGKAKNIFFVEGLRGKEHPILKAKLIPRSELANLGDFLRRRGRTKVVTTGVYDMIHIGHARYLELAKSLAGDLGALLVGLNSDKSVRALKGPSRPILGEERRAEMLSFLEFVDYITIYDEPTGANVIDLFKPDKYLCVEGSWQGDLATKDEVKEIQKVGGQVYYTPRQDPSLSTTEIIKRIEVDYGETLMNQFKKMVQAKL